MAESEGDEINAPGSLAAVLLESEGGLSELFENLPELPWFIRLDRSLGHRGNSDQQGHRESK
jgi:hypothetical protein